jgi:hypothetical protein
MSFSRFNYLAMLILASALLCLPTTSWAAGSFSITPGKEEISLAPGGTVIKNLTIVNNLGRVANFTLGLEDIAASDQAGEVIKFLDIKASPYSFKKYLNLPLTNFTLKSGESKIIPIAVETTANTPPGGYFGALTVSAAPEGKTATKVTARVASLWFIRVTGPVKESGRLLDFGPLGSKWFLGSKELRFQFSFQNDGNTYLNPYGGIELKPRLAWGFTRSIIVPPNFILPGSTRLQEITAPAGTFCGWYKTTLKLNRGYGNLVDEQSGHLIACGRGLSAIFILILLTLVGLGWWLMVKLKRAKEVKIKL